MANAGEPKTESSNRTQQIGPLAQLLLNQASGKAEAAFLVGRENGSPDQRDLQREVLRPAAEAVKIYTPGFGMHAFRRLNITWRQQVGATAIEAMLAAGHTRIDMTALYSITDEPAAASTCSACGTACFRSLP